MVRTKLLYRLTALLHCGCEVIREGDRLQPVPIPQGGGNRTHVLLEYTGFRCVNCPEAAQTAQTLHDYYGERLTVVALHPASNPFTQGAYDYTCPAADSCYRFMGGTATTPFPTGNIDGIQTEKGYFLDPKEWAGEITRRMTDTLAPHLTLTAEYDHLSRTVYLLASTYADSTYNCRLAVWLVEDSVAGVQAMPDGTVNTHYMHRHMLRTTADDGPWGSPITVSGTLTQRQLSMILPDECDRQHCTVVALLWNADNYQILQAYETTLDFSIDY